MAPPKNIDSAAEKERKRHIPIFHASIHASIHAPIHVCHIYIRTTTKVVGYLPAIDGGLVPRVVLHDPLVNVVECHLLVGAALDGGGDEVRVRVRWLGAVLGHVVHDHGWIHHLHLLRLLLSLLLGLLWL